MNILGELKALGLSEHSLFGHNNNLIEGHPGLINIVVVLPMLPAGRLCWREQV